MGFGVYYVINNCGDFLDMGVVQDWFSNGTDINLVGGDIMNGCRVMVDGLIPTWRLSCGHIVVSPIISSGIGTIRICIPKTMSCPECEGRAEGLPRSEWSGGDIIG